MGSMTSYHDPEDEFREIIYSDPILKSLTDDSHREVNLDDENTLIIQDDPWPRKDSNPDFWSDR